MVTNLKFQSKYESLPITKWNTEQQIISQILRTVAKKRSNFLQLSKSLGTFLYHNSDTNVETFFR